MDMINLMFMIVFLILIGLSLKLNWDLHKMNKETEVIQKEAEEVLEKISALTEEKTEGGG